MLRRREHTVHLDDRRSITLRRPPEAQMGRLLSVVGEKATWSVGPEDVKAAVVGWAGFTEADLLGATVGSSDAVPFDADLFALYIDDHLEDQTKIAKVLLDVVTEYVDKRGASEKNSDSGSTSSTTSQPAAT